jgi:phosphatidylglycerol lysyltransferase
MFRKIILALLALALASATWQNATASDQPLETENQTTINLKRDKLTVFEYLPKKNSVSAIILFSSGDGGWNQLEDQVAHNLCAHGFEVIGVDSAAYASSDYDLGTLQTDYGAIAQMAESPFHAHPLPLIVGGYSMGAAQAIAVAGGPHPPPDLVGLFLMDPLSRGRFGLRDADQMNVLPTGIGTFGVADFANNLKNIRIVQWHAANDPIDSRAWLTSLTVPYKEFDLPGAGHNYDVGRDAFLEQLVDSVNWILGPDQKRTLTAGAGNDR